MTPHKEAPQSAPDTRLSTMGAAARRELARRDYLEQLRGCPGHLVIGLVSERWATLIVEALAEGPRRHSDLRRQIPGATQKMLTQTLRTLQRSGLVTRSVQYTIPVRVDYALTTLGQDFYQLQRSIYAWAVNHAEEIRRARVAFDLNVPSGAETLLRDAERRLAHGHLGAG